MTKTFATLIGAFIALRFIDVYMTWYFVETVGMLEMNSIAREAYHSFGSIGIVLYQMAWNIVWVGVIALMIYRLKKQPDYKPLVQVATIGAVVVMSLVIGRWFTMDDTDYIKHDITNRTEYIGNYTGVMDTESWLEHCGHLQGHKIKVELKELRAKYDLLYANDPAYQARKAEVAAERLARRNK
tara:strand:+ start:3676 stop:4227 length:552 start_codon:yes stop_codon:yes gene_type:complete